MDLFWYNRLFKYNSYVVWIREANGGDVSGLRVVRMDVFSPRGQISGVASRGICGERPFRFKQAISSFSSCFLSWGRWNNLFFLFKYVLYILYERKRKALFRAVLSAKATEACGRRPADLRAGRATRREEDVFPERRAAPYFLRFLRKYH